MAYLLHIETSAHCCSVALSHHDSLLAVEQEEGHHPHMAAITKLLQKVMATVGIRWPQLDAVAVSAGPGSYTGLRIGVASAKAICSVWNKPLLAVDTLAIMAHAARQWYPEGKNYCSALAARQQWVYWAMYDADVEVVVPPQVASLNQPPALDLPPHGIWVGPAARLCVEQWQIPCARYNVHIVPHAQFMVAPALRLFQKNMVTDLIHFEPEYLKPPYIVPSTSARQTHRH